ncbi:hypothetical protein JKP88DRAFT_308146 [Tribonema minus]|uniref:Uncharacterized protein n=1 Tax=Tribonema minus TaxID=303371 RepID=A0A835Z7G3_9STRA|nr:hypothetical protein JKP88DRAFT_308146 [Tribonema minus]
MAAILLHKAAAALQAAVQVSSQNHEGRQQAQGEQPDDTQGSTASNGNNPGGDGETNGGSALGDANGGSNNDSNGAAPCKYERRRRSSSASDIHYHVVPAGEVCRLVPHNPSAAAAALPAAAGAAKPVVIVRLQCSPPALVQRSAASTLVRARLLSSAAALAAALALARAAAAAPPPWHLAAAARAAALLGLGCALSPYLLRSSRYRRDPRLRCRLGRRDVRRRLRDPLVWTSLVYAVPALYGVAAHQYGVAALQAATTVGSTLFHRARETRYFNLDNVGALALLFTTAWSLALAARARVWAHAAVVLAGTPLAGYFMVACGMPGVVCACPSGDGTLRRASNPLYDHYHMLWHLVSGFGTIASIHFFASRYPHLDAGGGHFEHFPDVPVVPFVSLLLSAAVNVYGNWAGALPLS